MAKKQAGVVTQVLQAAQAGNQEAVAQLLPLLYEELHRLAQARMSKLPPGQTLQPTALINEAYLRLVGKKDLHLESRKHFFFAAARAMRDILVERARSRIAEIGRLHAAWSSLARPIWSGGPRPWWMRRRGVKPPAGSRRDGLSRLPPEG